MLNYKKKIIICLHLFIKEWLYTCQTFSFYTFNTYIQLNIAICTPLLDQYKIIGCKVILSLMSYIFFCLLYDFLLTNKYNTGKRICINN